MEEHEQVLSRSVAAKVRPHYQRSLKRRVEPARAYADAYEEVVKLVAAAQKSTADKVRFASRDVLQEAMQLVTQ